MFKAVISRTSYTVRSQGTGFIGAAGMVKLEPAGFPFRSRRSTVDFAWSRKYTTSILKRKVLLVNLAQKCEIKEWQK